MSNMPLKKKKKKPGGRGWGERNAKTEGISWGMIAGHFSSPRWPTKTSPSQGRREEKQRRCVRLQFEVAPKLNPEVETTSSPPTADVQMTAQPLTPSPLLPSQRDLGYQPLAISPLPKPTYSCPQKKHPWSLPRRGWQDSERPEPAPPEPIAHTALGLGEGSRGGQPGPTYLSAPLWPPWGRWMGSVGQPQDGAWGQGWGITENAKALSWLLGTKPPSPGLGTRVTVQPLQGTSREQGALPVATGQRAPYEGAAGPWWAAGEHSPVGPDVPTSQNSQIPGLGWNL